MPPGISAKAAHRSTSIRWRNASFPVFAPTCAISRPRAEIAPADLEAAVKKAGVPVPKGGTVLLCTGHHERTFPRKEYSTDNSGVSVAATEWLAKQGVVHFGIDSMRPGPEGDVNALVHKACLDLDITHIESLCNLEALLCKGEFTFIGLPMKWRGGTASPIRAVAVFDM
jgi:kynurenine formamidase